MAVDGLISVLNKYGIIVGEIIIPKLSEITGLLISPKKKDMLYVTDRNTNSVIKIKLTSFISEIEKLEEFKLKA